MRVASPGLIVASVATAAWLYYGLTTGPSLSGDSESYIAFARALSEHRIPTSERTPVYPALIAVSEGVGGLFGAAPLVSTLVVQAVLVGLSIVLLYSLAHRITGSVLIATGAAVLLALDVDTQNLSGWIMSEPLANTLLLLALLWRVVDGDWRRAGWVVAVVVLTRPLFVFLPPLFAAVEFVRTRSARAAMPLAGPAILVGGLWLAVSWAGAAAPSKPVAVFLPRHVFGRVYEFDLWRSLPESRAREIIEAERRRGSDAYTTLDRLSVELGPDAWIEVLSGVVRAAPGPFALSFVRAVPRVFRQAVLWRPVNDGTAFQIAAALHAWFWGILFWPPPMLFAFGMLMAFAVGSGFGYAPLQAFYRWVGVPFVVGLFGSIALLAMGTDSVGRLALGFRPLYYLALASALAGVVRSMRAWSR